ncbi:WD40/YVTN/BNR-like repeat-containing protein [Chitinimonas naiadis]
MIDSGVNYLWQMAGTTADLKRALAIDRHRAFITGDNGTLLKTIDGGQSWVQQGVATRANLSGITALDRNLIWVVRETGTLLRTTNGEASWQSTSPLRPYSSFKGVSIADANNRWIVGNGIYRSRDRGLSWYEQRSMDGMHQTAISQVDILTAWVVGDSGSLRTASGGD